MKVKIIAVSAAAAVLAAGAAVGVAVAQPGAPAAAGPALPKPGIYQVWGSESTVARDPWVVGGQIVLQWAQVEPAPGQFDFSSLAAQLHTYRELGKPTTVQINGEQKPSWLWNQVPTCGSYHGEPIPQYWNPLYLHDQTQMIDALASFLNASPDRSVVALVRSAPDAIGTELTTVPGNAVCSLPGGKSSPANWNPLVGFLYYQQIMGAWYQALSPNFHVALRAQLFTTRTPAPPLSWLGVDKAWMMGTATDINPNPGREAFDVLAEQWARTGRTEAYWEQHNVAGVHNLVSWNYWRLLLELQKGVAYAAVYGQLLQMAHDPTVGPEFQAAFNFFDRYAGYQDSPATSPGAWVALRQGTGLMAGNFGWYLTQLNPDTTSIALDSNEGVNMIGPATQRFGRYAREIIGGTPTNTMSFALDPTFRASLAGGSAHLVVTYLDNSTGSFRVSWGAGPADSAVVTKTGTGSWKQVSIPVSGDAFTGGALGGGADIAVSATGTDRTVLHMLELQVDSRVGNPSPSPSSPSPTPTSPSPTPTSPSPTPTSPSPTPTSPSPTPTGQAPYGAYGLWGGSCSHTGAAPYTYGEIATHWDQYRGTASVYDLTIAATFSPTATPKPPVLNQSHTVTFPVSGIPGQYGPLAVGGRHQNGPLYLKFRQPWQHAVISVEFYWFDQQGHLLWQSPRPVNFSC